MKEKLEKLIIACTEFLSPEQILSTGLKSSDFSDAQSQQIWKYLIECAQQNRKITIIDLRSRFPELSDYLAEIGEMWTEINDPFSQSREYSISLKTYNLKILLLQKLSQILKRLKTEEPQTIISELYNFLSEFRENNNHTLTCYEKIAQFLRKGIIKRTGYTKLDAMTQGIDSGFWVIGGFSSHGKTNFMLNIIYNLLQQNVKIVFITAEMSPELLLMRLCTMKTGINFHTIYTDEEKEIYLNAVKEIEKQPLTIITTNSLSEIKFEIYKRKGEVYFIDYLQLIYPDIEIEREIKKLGYICRELFTASQQTGIPVVLASQLNRSSQDKEVPGLSAFRGSGEIEESADISILLWRPFALLTDEDLIEKYKLEGKDKIIKVGIAKNRLYGQCGYFNLYMNFKTLRIQEEE